MSDIIPFPGLVAGLNRQLEQYQAAGDFEKAYDVLIELERHSELTDQQQLIKLTVLNELESFLELREEASIMLNHGHPNYEETIYYFLISLLELGQYQTVSELIDALRAEKIEHRLKMKLLPLYDRARHKMNERERRATTELADFLDWPAERQQQFIIRLIRDHNLTFATTFMALLTEPLHPVVQTLLVQYLHLSGQEEIISLVKLNQTIRFNIASLATIEEQPLIQEVLPLVTDWFDSNMPDMTAPVKAWLETQATIIYPLTFHFDDAEIASDIIADCYIHAALSMFSLEDIYPFEGSKEHHYVLELITQAVKYEL